MCGAAWSAARARASRVTPPRACGRSTADGSSPCCGIGRACRRSADRCWSAAAARMRCSAAVSGSVSAADRRGLGPPGPRGTSSAAPISCSVNGCVLKLGRVLGDVPGYLRGGSDDSVEEAVAAGRVQVHRRGWPQPRDRNARWRRPRAGACAPAPGAASCPAPAQLVRCSRAVLVSPAARATLASSRLRRTAGRRPVSSAGEPQVTEGQAEQCFLLVGEGQQGGARVWAGSARAASTQDSASRTCPRASPDPGLVQQGQEFEERLTFARLSARTCSVSCSAASRSRRSSARPASARR